MTSEEFLKYRTTLFNDRDFGYPTIVQINYKSDLTERVA